MMYWAWQIKVFVVVGCEDYQVVYQYMFIVDFIYYIFEDSIDVWKFMDMGVFY